MGYRRLHGRRARRDHRRGFASQIANAVEGIGQELFNATILFAAVCMLGWHNIWMSRHGRELAAESTRIGNEVRAGSRPLYALALVCGIAVLREGSEVVLFLYGIAVAGGSSGIGMIIGGALGVVAGAAAGAAIYFGLLKIPLRYLFSTTSWLILLLAAGMASQGAAFLAAADVLPSLEAMRHDPDPIVRRVATDAVTALKFRLAERPAR